MSGKMRIIESVREWRGLRSSEEMRGGSVGFVPTMGALHEGHLELVRRSVAENDRTVVSIFVNPTQFNDPKDLEKYPRDLQADAQKLESVGCRYLLTPRYEELYPDLYRYKVSESAFSRILCGAHRPGHFDGVLSVVMKLLNLVRADRAYFGEKDYQQLRLIQGMVEAFFMETRIIPCPTVREADGLAMSSRNMRLSPEAREKAPLIFKALSTAETVEQARERLERAGFTVEYLEEQDGRRFCAAFLDGVRLIDNVAIR